mmetsp:Transcript_81741/g.226409  ORF Transcript_81741/g.226409 Transcript_81741/m.226409 type:complete len:588 (-) Transcript_81741:46-1809(-)
MVLAGRAHEASAALMPLTWVDDLRPSNFPRHMLASAAFLRSSGGADASLELLQGVQPMSPALRCVVSLTALFFGVYLIAVFARFARVMTSLVIEKRSQPTRFEMALAPATDALALVPMLCVLMISTRLRAMQLGLPDGDPPSWVQTCMYADTAAFVLRFFFDMVIIDGNRSGSTVPHHALYGAYCGASLVLYAGSAAIVVGMLSMGAGGEKPRPALSTMMQCMTFMAVSYIVECLVLETLKVIHTFRVGAREQQSHRAKARGLGNEGEGRMETYEVLMNALAEKRQPDMKEQLTADSVFFQFPLMLCVLLVGVSLRAVQLRLEVELWSCIAMYVTTGAIVVWAFWGLAAANSWLWEIPTAPGSPDAGAGSVKVRSCTCSSAGWVALIGIVYSGTALILAGVFAMENKPLDVLWPEVAYLLLQWTGGASHTSSAPPLSTAMHCVMLLTVLYFGVHLCLMLGRLARGPIAKWAGSVLSGIQRSLAFAPMLCVMMIAVRLRAMQIRMRDPQPWAQTAMCIATFGVVVQVGCSLFPIGEDAENDDCGKEDQAELVGKLAAIALLSLRHAASAAFYIALATLVVALLFMESE